ncbi:MAG: right-handed parallel beta-helix repeat-containing protein [Bacilli bacterium]|jgi:hypothetical protein
MIFRQILISSVFLAVSVNAQAKGTIYLKDYLNRDSISSVDAMPALRAALEDCAKQGASELVLPGGTLNLKPDYAFEQYEYISNNDPSMKRIAFCLREVKNFTIKGNGTRLLFSGFISAFSLANCSNIRIEELSIDYVRPFVSESAITNAGDGWLEVKFPDSYLVNLQEGQLQFRDENGVTYPYSSLLEFDPKLKEVAYHVHDYWIWGESLPAVKTADGSWRFYRKDFGEAHIGNNMVFGATARMNPAFTLLECENFYLGNVTIYHCGGMGVIAQSSRNIELNRVNVVPSPGSGRTISISADATHFVNCKGYIKMIDCDFRNQKDDATNIHGWYMAVDQIIGNNKLILRWKNSGQYGVEFIRKGMPLELVNNKTMESYARLIVDKVRYLNSQYAEVTFAKPLPKSIEPNHIVAEDDEYPDVLIRGCYIGNNRARGLLIGSRGHVVIEKCTFHTPGAAILFEGDGSYWFEQSGVRNVIIRDNLFENCMYGSTTWGSACIAVGSGIPDKAHSLYHKNITVENNIFRGFDNRIVNIYCVDGFVFKNNTIEMTDDYPAYGDPGKRFIANDCENVVFELK